MRIKKLKQSKTKQTSYWTDGGYCFNCGVDKPMYIINWKVEHYRSKFCPRCGLRMTNPEEVY